MCLVGRAEVWAQLPRGAKKGSAGQEAGVRAMVFSQLRDSMGEWLQGLCCGINSYVSGTRAAIHPYYLLFSR